MKLVKPSFGILEQEPGLDGIYKAIERAGRTCYKSEDKITEDSAKKFVDMLINRGHTAVLEQGTVYLVIPLYYANSIDFPHGELDWILNCPYSKVSIHENKELNGYVDWTGRTINPDCYYITTNYRVIKEAKAEELLKYLSEPTEYHHRRYTVRFICDRGVSHELVRHRVFSFAQESTRYCNYSKDKFGSELTFIIPSWSTVNEEHLKPRVKSPSMAEGVMLRLFMHSESDYLYMLEQGLTPQQARQVLPNALKTEVVMTGFIEDWNHFFELRCDNAAHPDMRALAIPLKEEFIKREYING